MLRRSILGLLLCAGCTLGDAGESTPKDCSNGRDDDHDGLEDCADPGCRALESCALGPAPVVPPPGNALLGEPMATLPLGPDAGGAITPFDAGDDDAGDPPEPAPDAAVIEEPPPCGGSCTATQSCIDNECRDVTSETEGRFQLRVLSALSPSRGYLAICLDSDCGAFPISCRCSPDPLVRVVRLRESPGSNVEVVEIGRTVAVTNDASPEYTDPPFDLDLEPGDALRFEVWDADPEVQSAEFVFECRPDLRELAPGQIECSDRADRKVVAQVIAVP